MKFFFCITVLLLLPCLSPFLSSIEAREVNFMQNFLDRQNGPVLKKKALDSDVQNFVIDTLKVQLASSLISTDAAVIVLNNHTGELLSYIPGIDSGEQSQASTHRAAFGILDPFLEALAIKKNLLDPKALLQQKQVLLKGKKALESIPLYLGNKEISSYMERIGFRGLAGTDFTHPKALERAKVSLWEIANAYRVFINGGLYSEVNTDGQFLKHKSRVLPLGVSYSMMNSLSMRSKMFRDMLSSFSEEISLSFWNAFKLGVSADGKSNWCIGFSKNYTVGVWLGLAENASFAYMDGSSKKLTEKIILLWSRIMDRVQKKTGNSTPNRAVANSTNSLLKERTLALNFKERLSFANSTWQRILYPKHGMLLAVDHLTAEKDHKIRLRVHPRSESLRLAINGVILGSANMELLWNLERGKHILTLNDQYDNVIDKVHFEVR